MLQAFMIVLREGFEAFLIVSVIVSYLHKTGRAALLAPVRWGIAAAVVLSFGLGALLMQRGFDPLWEGVLGLVAVALVSSLVVQMWRHARFLKRETETQLDAIAARPSPGWAAWGVFVFTVLMVSREGIETALLLIQVHDPLFILGALGGLAVTAGLCWLWVKCSHLIDLRLFFQVTSIFLLLFLGQVLIYALHELSEAGLFPNSEAFHMATEAFSPEGLYGKWFSLLTVAVCAVWLLGAWVRRRWEAQRKQ